MGMPWVGQPIAWSLVVSRWLPISIFKLSDTPKRYFWNWWWYTPPGCKPNTSEPTLCYKASINNPTRTREHFSQHMLIVSIYHLWALFYCSGTFCKIKHATLLMTSHTTLRILCGTPTDILQEVHMPDEAWYTVVLALHGVKYCLLKSFLHSFLHVSSVIT